MEQPVTLKCLVCGRKIAFLRMPESVAVLVHASIVHKCGACLEKAGGAKDESEELLHVFPMPKVCKVCAL
jgi:hypothetical protein